MGKATDLELRERLRGWLRHYVNLHRSQVEVARLMGCTPAAVSQILSGKKPAGLDTLKRMHRGLGVSADALLDAKPPRPNEHEPPNPRSASPDIARRGGIGGQQ